MSPLAASFATLLILALACRIWLLSRQGASAHAAREHDAGSVSRYRAAGGIARRATTPSPGATRDRRSDPRCAAAGCSDLGRSPVPASTQPGARKGLTGVLLGLAVISSTALITAFIGWPLSLYRVFGIETRFGFSRMTWRLYLGDLLKSLLLTIALGAPLLALVLWLMQKAGANWWSTTLGWPGPHSAWY